MGNIFEKKSEEPKTGEEKVRSIYRPEKVKGSAKAGDRGYPLSPGRERTELPTSRINDICSRHGPIDSFSSTKALCGSIIGESKEDASNLKRAIRSRNTKSNDHLVMVREMWRSLHEDQQERDYSFRLDDPKHASSSKTGILGLSVDKHQTLVRNTKNVRHDELPSRCSTVTSEEDTSNLKRGIQPHDTKSSDDIMGRKKLQFLHAQDRGQSFSGLGCNDCVRASSSKTRMRGLSVDKTAENQTLVRNTKNTGHEDLPSRVASEEDTSNLKRGKQPHDTKSSDDIMVRKKLLSLQQLQHVQERGQSFSSARGKHRESASKLKKAIQPLQMTAENQGMVREMLQSLHSIKEDNMAFSENEISEEDEAEIELDEQPKRHSSFVSSLDVSHCKSVSSVKKPQNKVDGKSKVKYMYSGAGEAGFKMQNKQQDKVWTSTQNSYPKKEEKCLGICSNPIDEFREKQIRC